MNMKMAVARLKRAPIKLEVMERLRNEVRMLVPREGGGYFLYLDLTGKGKHHCTCLDYLYFATRRWMRERTCLHVVAAILQENRPEMLMPLMMRESRGHRS